MALDFGQLVALAQGAGLPADAARVAAAIALAESSGNPQAHNARPPDDSYGLWQINMLGSLGPARRAAYGLHRNADLFDPATNARAMSGISKQGKNFNPWSTYKSGSYRQHLGGSAGGATNADPALFGLGLPDVPGLDQLGEVVDAVRKSAAWVSDSRNWLRVAAVVGGSAIALAGLVMLVQQTGPGRTATTVAKKVASRGVLK